MSLAAPDQRQILIADEIRYGGGDGLQQLLGAAPARDALEA